MSDDNSTYTGALLERLNPRLWHMDVSNTPPGTMRRAQSQLGRTASQTPLRSRMAQLEEIVTSIAKTGTIGGQFRGPFYAQVLSHYGPNGYINLADQSTWGAAGAKIAPFIDWFRNIGSGAELCSNALVPAFYARIPELDPIYPTPGIGNPTNDPENNPTSKSHFGVEADFYTDKYPLYIGIPWEKESLKVPPVGSVVVVDYLDGLQGAPVRQFIKLAVPGLIAQWYEGELSGEGAKAPKWRFVGSANEGIQTLEDANQKSEAQAQAQDASCGRPTISAGGESCHYDEEIVEDQPGWEQGGAPNSHAAKAIAAMQGVKDQGISTQSLQDRGWNESGGTWYPPKK